MNNVAKIEGGSLNSSGSDTASSLNEALIRAQLNMSNASLDKHNAYHNSKYASLTSVRDAVLSALNNEGIALVQLTRVRDGSTVVLTQLRGFGEVIESETPVILGQSKNPTQAFGSALTYARRYGMAAICCVSSDDDDDGNSSGENHYANGAGESSSKSPRKNMVNNQPEPSKDTSLIVSLKTTNDGRPDYDRWVIAFCEAIKNCKSPSDMSSLKSANRDLIIELGKDSEENLNSVKAVFKAHEETLTNPLDA